MSGGSSYAPKPRMQSLLCVVGERRNFIEAVGITPGGGVSSEDAGMSSEKTGENPVRRKPKGS